MELNATIFIQIFIFVIALLWLSPSLFVPIIRLFEERDRRIRGAKIESEELNALALEKGRVFDMEYEKARDKARGVLSHIKQAAEKEHAEILSRIKAESSAKLMQSEADLQDQCQQVRGKLDAQASHIASDIVNALLRRHA